MTATPPKRPWYMSPAQWRLTLADQAAAQHAAQTPPVPPEIWARLTPMEQAQLMAQHQGQQAIVRAQQQSGRRVSSTLVVIFVVIPIVVVLFLVIASVVSRS